MKKVALIPVYNEQATVVSVVEAMSPLVDLLVIVDDGSSDNSLALAQERARAHGHVEVLSLPENRGMSSALREGFVYVSERLRRGELDPEDILLNLDADGQHDPRQIGALCSYMERLTLDVALTQRRFDLYPAHKRLGNRIMTLWGSLWSGFPYQDVESGFRAMRLKVLSPLLDYYFGYRYSCAQEIAILTARLGFRVDNNFATLIQHYRSQTGMRDVFINAGLGFWAFVRWGLRRKVVRRTSAARLVIPSEHL